MIKRLREHMKKPVAMTKGTLWAILILILAIEAITAVNTFDIWRRQEKVGI